MTTGTYTLQRALLLFRDPATESEYQQYILDRTLLFSRIAWALIIVLGAIFGILDKPVFGAKAGMVIAARGVLLLVATTFIAATFIDPKRRLLPWSSPLIIISTGSFCVFQVLMSDPSAFTPYFTGLFFAFAGAFSTPGLGFRFSLGAMLAILGLFEVTVGLFTPVPPMLFAVYTFFLVGSVVVLGFSCYFIEWISRENYTVSGKLSTSLAEVRTLSGLLPICSYCKKIRDDKGYWSQLEAYLSTHSDAQLSHGICPDCLHTHHPELKDLPSPE